MAYRAGTAFVQVVPSLRGFQENVARQTRGMRATVTVDVDDRGLRGLGQQLSAVARNVTARVSVETGEARTGLGLLDRLLGRVDGRRVKARVDVDVTGALRDVAGLAVAVNRFANRKYTFHVDADTAGAVGSVAMLASKVFALGGGVGIAGGLAGALAGIAPAGAAALAGVLPLIGAFNGVGDAYKALSDQQTKSITEGVDNARKSAAAANQVISAQEAVNRSATEVARARRDGARSVADAEEQGAERVAAALEQADQAHRDYQAAANAVRRAQSDLNAAYEDGRRSLQDLQDQLDMTVLDQRQAAVDLADARDRLAEAKGSGDTREIERAQIAYDRQVETIDELSKRAVRLKTDNTAAQAAGVSGTDAVVSATQRLTEAQTQQADARVAASKADAAVTKAQAEASTSVARAREQASERVADAQAQAADATRALAQAQMAAADSQSSSADKVTQTLAALNPAQRQFALYLFSLKPLMEQLSDTAASNFFPALQGGMQALVSQGPAVNGIVANLSSAMGDAAKTLLTGLATPEWVAFFQVLSEGAKVWLPMMAQTALLFGTALRTLLTDFMPLAPAAFDLFNQLAGLLTILSPFIAMLLGGLIPAASAFLSALTPLGPLLAALTPILAVLGTALAQVLLAVLQALTPILIALTPLIVAFAQAWADGITSTLQVATPILTAVAGFLSEHASLLVTLTGVVGGLGLAFHPLLFVLGLLVTHLHNMLILRVVLGAVRALGLGGGLLEGVLVRLLSPFSLIKELLPWIARGLGMIGRAILGAMGPLGWLLTIVGFLYSSNAQFRDMINSLLQTLMQLAGQVLSALMPAFNAIMGAISPLIPLIGSVLTPILTILADVFTKIINAVLPPLIMIIQTILVPVITFLAGILSGVLVWVIQTLVVPILQFLAWVLTNIVAPVIQWLLDNIVVPVFGAIGAFIGWVWNSVIKPIFDGLVWFFQNVLAPVFRWLYDNVVKPYFDFIGAEISFIWNYVIKPVWDALVWFIQNVIAPAAMWLWNNVIKPAWDGIGSAISWVWENVIKPCWDAIMTGLDWLRNGFDTAVGFIRDAWDKLKGFLAKPVNFLIQTVWNDGIRQAWNFAARLLPGVDEIPELNKIPEFASGGLLRGPGTGTSDSILGVSAATGAPSAWVSNGEFVVNASVTRKTLPFLSALNAGNGEALQAAGGLARVSKTYRGPAGSLPFYAAGGPIEERVKAAVDWFSKAEGMPYVWGGTVTPSFSGTDCSGMQAAVTHIMSGRSPYSGRIGTTASMPWGGFVPGIDGTYAIGNKPSDHMAATLAGNNVEQHGPNGNPFAFPSRWGADNGYFPQKWHLAEVGGQFVSGGGEGGGFFNWILDKVRGAFDSMTNPVIDAIGKLMGPPPPAFRAVPPTTATNLRDKVRDFIFGKAEDAGGSDMLDTSGITGPVQDQVRQVAARFGWDQGAQWNALATLVQHESGWNPNAANPTSTARGLFQKMTSKYGPLEPTPAAQAGWGLSYIRDRYTDPIGAWNFWQGHHWYDDGGYLMPGATAAFNGTRSPEAVLTGAQWDDVSALARRGAGGGTFTGRLYLDDGAFLGQIEGVLDDVADDINDGIR